MLVGEILGAICAEGSAVFTEAVCFDISQPAGNRLDRPLKQAATTWFP
jgi:hypothetical protein